MLVRTVALLTAQRGGIAEAAARALVAGGLTATAAAAACSARTDVRHAVAAALRV
eukprot:SAG31_NODE_5264_length_2644_cov_1.197250_4_plen_55_part_00